MVDQFDLVDMILDKAKYLDRYDTYYVYHNGQEYEAADPKDLVAKVKADMEEN